MLISIFYLTSLFLIKNKIENDEYCKHLKKCWMEREKRKKKGGEMEKETKNEWRRFKPKGTEEEMEELDRLMSEKELTRDDLILIFKCLEPIWKNIL